MEPKFKRVMLKLSGEGMSGADKNGIDVEVIKKLASQIVELYQRKVQVCIVVGGGNFSAELKKPAQ